MRKLIFIAFFIQSCVFAVTFSGHGVALTQQQAKNEALRDLSNSLISEVKSTLKTIQRSDMAEANVIQTLEINSQVPLIVVDITSKYSISI
jgi:hypothetical protein